MAGITKFISDKSREKSIIEQFNLLLKKAKTVKEIREIEMRLLRPEPIRKYQGTKAAISPFKRRSVLVVFPNEGHINRLAKFMRLSTYQGNNTHDVELFIELFSLLESGRIKWRPKKKKFYFKTKKGKEIKL